MQNGLIVSPFSFLCWHRSIFPGRLQPSIVDAGELNFCVRDGNRCTLIAKDTDLSTSIIISYLPADVKNFFNIFI